MIKRDHKETASCKIALYRAFLKCGVKTWKQVIVALEGSGNHNFAEQVKLNLVKLAN